MRLTNINVIIFSTNVLRLPLCHTIKRCYLSMQMKFYLTFKVLESFLQVNVTLKKRNVKEADHYVQYTKKSVAMNYENMLYICDYVFVFSSRELLLVRFWLQCCILYPGKIDLKFSYSVELKITFVAEELFFYFSKNLFY